MLVPAKQEGEVQIDVRRGDGLCLDEIDAPVDGQRRLRVGEFAMSGNVGLEITVEGVGAGKVQIAQMRGGKICRVERILQVAFCTHDGGHVDREGHG
ncbi:hypothetical protein [Mesorhizobium sp. B2-4-15]|uniref:hypothetical protein n=1 Tax=Mesorhizobium sp. B2-4-15 TaxID=2589934 RepID=UPI001FEF222E|nr:hypothetical protein [Mesorhizobium sp. B2-4-15]